MTTTDGKLYALIGPEHATVLAALRYWQALGPLSDRRAVDADALLDIATNGETHPALTADEIDTLCERLNCGPTIAMTVGPGVADHFAAHDLITESPPCQMFAPSAQRQASDLSLLQVARDMLTIADIRADGLIDDDDVLVGLDLIADAMAIAAPGIEDKMATQDIAESLEQGFRAWATNLREDLAAKKPAPQVREFSMVPFSRHPSTIDDVKITHGAPAWITGAEAQRLSDAPVEFVASTPGGFQVPPTATLSVDAIATLTDAADSYHDDLASGLEDGTYDEGREKLAPLAAALVEARAFVESAGPGDGHMRRLAAATLAFAPASAPTGAPSAAPDAPLHDTAREYLVMWEIELDATSPRDAARKALEIQRDCDSIANVFKIADPVEGWITIDLAEDEGD